MILLWVFLSILKSLEGKVSPTVLIEEHAVWVVLRLILCVSRFINSISVCLFIFPDKYKATFSEVSTSEMPVAGNQYTAQIYGIDNVCVRYVISGHARQSRVHNYLHLSVNED